MERAQMELLAPAGNYECLVAAVQNGADAVYFGGGAYNARRSAANFSNDMIESAVDYCRLRGVKTYITLNTLLFDREIADAVEFAAQLYRMGSSAVIVQDLGLAAILREELPKLKIHASTQMGVHDLGGLQFCERNGITRAVLARETSLEQIRYLKANSQVELEFFAHGALCMSFSGSCLYSSMSGERSGNRGLCAQPCRKNASVSNASCAQKSEFALSPNDICMIEKLNELRNAGICCIKLEGRMKQPEYVATVTRIYRQALDGYTDPKASRELFDVFNRGDFSTAHLTGDSVKTGRVGCAKPPKELLLKARDSMRGEIRQIPVVAELSVERGLPSRLRLESGGAYSEVEGEEAAEPEKPISLERCKAQLEKLGGTPFTITACLVKGDGYLPISALNALRRNAVDALTQKLLQHNTDPLPINGDEALARHLKDEYDTGCRQTRVYAKVRDIAQMEVALKAGAAIVAYEPVLPSKTDISAIAKLRGKYPGASILIAFPNVLITKSATADFKRLVDGSAFDGAEINNIGHLDLARGLEYRVAGVGLNITNRMTAKKLLSIGFTHIMPSIELTMGQTAELIRAFGSRIILYVYGYAPLMQLLHCPVQEYRGCQNCNGVAGYVKDAEGRRFLLSNIRFSDGSCLVRMKNCNVTDIIEIAFEAGKAYAHAVDFDTLEDEVDRVVRRAVEVGLGKSGFFEKGSRNYTRGHWSRRVL